MKTFALQERPYVFARLWPVENPRGAVALVHGLGEHSGRYFHVAGALQAAGWVVVACDLPGHGRSEGKRGHFPSYDGVLDLIGQLLQTAAEQAPERPRVLYGHSLGGNLVLNFALRRPQELDGVIATGPWLRLAFEPPAAQVILARLVGKLWPAFTQPNGLDPKDLSHDPEVVRAYEEDPLVHDRISAGLFFAAYQAGLWALEQAHTLRVPALIMHGTEDRLTSAEASRAFAEAAGPQCTLRLWEGMYHEVHNEPQREEVLATVTRWLEEHFA